MDGQDQYIEKATLVAGYLEAIVVSLVHPWKNSCESNKLAVEEKWR